MDSPSVGYTNLFLTLEASLVDGAKVRVTEADSQIYIQVEPLETLVLAQFARYLVPDERDAHVSRRFLMDFAVLLLHHVSDAGDVIADSQAEGIPITEMDILSLRELVPATATVGTKPVGLSIHRKLHEALLRYHPEQAAELRFGEEEEPSRETFALELKRLKRRSKRWKK